MKFYLYQSNNLDILRAMPDNSVDAIVTDPPYGISFMGKKWDYDVPTVELWKECLRVLKPGGHLLAFAGTRTQHRMACRIEDAGFEIRDMIAWVYGSGMPKSLNISKAIDKAAGAEREVVGKIKRDAGSKSAHAFEHSREIEYDVTAPATDAAKQWDGFGTALKPALEPITLARKPISEATIAANVLRWGTGALNIDACRVGTDERIPCHYQTRGAAGHTLGRFKQPYRAGDACEQNTQTSGRWPANLIHDGSDEVVGLFPQTDNSGSAARYFYCAKASKSDRDEGLEGFEEKKRFAGGIEGGSIPLKGSPPPLSRNVHTTVKPTDLMRYLCRLVTPPGGIVLDPFAGSGSTGKAAILEGFNFIGMEKEPDYVKIARARIEFAAKSVCEKKIAGSADV